MILGFLLLLSFQAILCSARDYCDNSNITMFIGGIPKSSFVFRQNITLPSHLGLSKPLSKNFYLEVVTKIPKCSLSMQITSGVVVNPDHYSIDTVKVIKGVVRVILHWWGPRWTLFIGFNKSISNGCSRPITN